MRYRNTGDIIATNNRNFIGLDVVIQTILLSASFAAYAYLGYLLSGAGAFDGYDHIFNADPNRVIDDLAAGGFTYEVTTTRHPLFVLLLGPFGLLLNWFTGSKVVSAILLNSLFAALFVCVFYTLLRHKGLNRFFAVIFTVTLSLSVSTVVFGSVPDTFIFSAFGILLLFTVSSIVRDNRRFAYAFIPAAIFAVGMTSLNIVPMLIILLARLLPFQFLNNGEYKRPQLMKGLAAAALGVTIFLGLLGVERIVFPATFQITDNAKTDNLIKSYIRNPFPNGSLGIIEDSAAFYYKHNIISPGLYVSPESPPYVWPTVKSAYDYAQENQTGQYNLRFINYVLYDLVILISLYLLIKARTYKDRLFVALFAYYGFTVVLHYFYASTQIFVFSAHYTFPWLAMLALPLKSVGTLSDTSKKVVYTVFAAFLILLGANSWLFVNELLSAFLK